MLCANLVFSQEYYDQTNTPRQYYYNNLESATAGSVSTFLPAANGTRNSSAATTDIVSSSSLNGTKSLSTVGMSSVGYLRWNFLGTGTMSLANNTFEWEFDYKNVTGVDTNNPNPSMTGGADSWQYWLITADNTYGLYVTQNGGNLILRLKYGSASNQYTDYATMAMATNTDTYQIRIVKDVIGYYNIYILDRTKGTTTSKLSVNVGTNVSGVDLNTYTYSYLDATSAASNRFQWDNFNFYQQKVDYVGITSPANGITTFVYPGIVNAIPYGVNVNIRGDVIFGLLTFNSTANGQALFTGGTLYKTSSGVMSISTGTVLVTGVAINSGYTSQMSLPSSEYYYNAGNTDGTTVNVINYFLAVQGRNPFYTTYPTSIQYYVSSAAADNFQAFYTSGHFPSSSNANSTGAPVSAGNVYDWIGAVTTAWNLPTNWLYNGSTSTTVPGSGDIARIGVVAYTLLKNQPTVNVASSLGQLIEGSLNTPQLTLSTNLTIGTSFIMNPSATLTTVGGSGSLLLGGTSTVNSGATLTLTSSSTVSLQSSAVFNNSGTVAVNGLSVFTIPSSSSFSNANAFTMSGGTLNVTSSASFTNSATGTLTAGGSSTINCTASIFNTGGGVITIGSSGSPASLNMGTSGYFPNSGTVVVGPTSYINFTAGTNGSIQNANSVTLLSDGTGSAAITAVPSSSSYQGTINVQRFITGANSSAYRSYRLLSSPVAIANGGNYFAISYINTSQILLGSTIYGAVTGGKGTGFTVANNNPTIYFYNESLATNNSSFTSGKDIGVYNVTTSYVNMVPTPTTPTNLPLGNGYMFFFVGDNHINTLPAAVVSTRLPENTVLTATGYLNRGDVKVALWNTPTSYNLSFASPNSIPGFNLVGNPYPCTIDLGQLYIDNGSTGYSQFYVLDDVNPSQSFPSIDVSTTPYLKSSTTKSSNLIASGQGFFVKVTSGTQSITFKEDQKVTQQLSTTSTPLLVLNVRHPEVSAYQSTSAGTGKTNALVPTIGGLHLRLSKDSLTYDETGIYFANKWSDNFGNEDAAYLPGVSPKLYLASLTADGYKAAINAMADYSKGKKVKLYVQAVANGPYNLQMEDLTGIDTSIFNVSLIDHFTSDSVNIANKKAYQFTITNSDTTTFGANRFVLSIQRKILPSYQLESFTGQKASDGVLLTWKTSNEGTYTGFAIEKQNGSDTQYTTLYNVQGNGSGTYSFTDTKPVNGNNTYRLLQNDIDSNVTYTNPINVLYNSSSASGSLNLYPNPAKDLITVNFNSAVNTSGQNYQANIFSSSGVLVMQKSVSSNSWSQSVSALRPGAYILEIRATNGSLIGNAKFTKVQ